MRYKFLAFSWFFSVYIYSNILTTAWSGANLHQVCDILKGEIFKSIGEPSTRCSALGLDPQKIEVTDPSHLRVVQSGITHEYSNARVSTF